MANVGGRQVGNNDLGVMAAGVAALLFSFMPYWGVSYKGLGAGLGGSINAWHGLAFLGCLMIFAAAGIVAARVFGGVTLPTLPVGWYVIVAGLAGLGTLIVLVRGLTYPHASGLGASVGMKWGGYILVVAGIVEAVFAVMALRDSGESVSYDRGTPDTPPPAAT
jgi:hypothetical protein